MTLRRPLEGLFLPLTTPFQDDGEISPERLAEQIAVYRAFPLAGVIAFGTSGEGPLLDADEEGPLLAAAREAVPAEWALVVQVGKESVRATMAAAERAVEAGADALLCLPTRYYAIGPEVIAAYYRAVHGGVGLPVLAYHIPQRSHVDLPAEVLVRLAGEGVLDGIKESAGDLSLQAALKREAGAAFAVLNGKASLTAEALAAGADGAILAVADAAPEAALAIFDAHAAGDPEGARTAQRAILPLAECFGPRFGVPGIKAALDARGWPGGGSPRAPLAPLDQAGRAEVARALQAAGVEIAAALARG